MTYKELNNLYFDWLCQLVCDNKRYRRHPYSRLLEFLHSVDFEYTIPMDGNREADGVNLRYRFGHEEGYDDRIVASYLDDKLCSVLEMMVALAVRCEDNIMFDSDIGDRTGQWFWEMVESLGLMSSHDGNFSTLKCAHVIGRFLNRAYEPNGKGGLFTIEHPRQDLRTVEIWYQMCWYLSDNLES